MEQDTFQDEFQARLQAQMGKLLFDNIGQQLRMEFMGKEAALLHNEVLRLTPAEASVEGNAK